MSLNDLFIAYFATESEVFIAETIKMMAEILKKQKKITKYS